MFEEKLEELKEYKEFFEDVLHSDYNEREDFDDMELHSKVEDCENVIKDIDYSLSFDKDYNVDAPNQNNIVTKTKKLIEVLRVMIEDVKLRYFDENGVVKIEYVNTGDEYHYTQNDFLKDVLTWLNDEIIKKISKQGPYLNEEQINRLKMAVAK